MKENKGLSDKQLVENYEAGGINLAKALKESQERYIPIKRVVTERAKKK